MNAPIAFRACWVLLASLSPCIAANTINVPGDKPTIQAGIDAATDGDVVVVAPGVYAELIDFHGKAITLKSQQGPRVTTIDGQSSGTVITMQTFEGRNSVVQGFTITRGAASFGAGAYLLNSAPTFRQNIFLITSRELADSVQPSPDSTGRRLWTEMSLSATHATINSCRAS